jgi:hypothetical protein
MDFLDVLDPCSARVMWGNRTNRTVALLGQNASNRLAFLSGSWTLDSEGFPGTGTQPERVSRSLVVSASPLARDPIARDGRMV